ncbi:FAD-dependent oxidoreductase [Staphylococcus aureus]
MPTQLWPTLETKMIKNLYTAGQIKAVIAVMKKQQDKD